MPSQYIQALARDFYCRNVDPVISPKMRLADGLDARQFISHKYFKTVIRWADRFLKAALPEASDFAVFVQRMLSLGKSAEKIGGKINDKFSSFTKTSKKFPSEIARKNASS